MKLSIRLLLATCSLAFLSPATPDSFAIGEPAEAAERRIIENTVVSEHNPALAIRVDPALAYLGRHAIRIRDVAAGERIVFADHSAGSVKRMLIMQYEGFLPGIEEQYRYNLSNSPVVAGYPFRSNAFAFDLAVSRRENPGGESADTARFLEAKGLTFPNIWMMWRSLTVTDAARRNELIIFYVEAPENKQLTIADIYDPATDRSTDFWRRFTSGLERRANAAFQLATPVAGTALSDLHWQTVPVSQGN